VGWVLGVSLFSLVSDMTNPPDTWNHGGGKLIVLSLTLKSCMDEEICHGDLEQNKFPQCRAGEMPNTQRGKNGGGGPGEKKKQRNCVS